MESSEVTSCAAAVAVRARARATLAKLGFILAVQLKRVVIMDKQM